MFFISIFLTSLLRIQAQEFVVNSTEDLPDADISDNIFFPQTLRSALENIEAHGGTQIRFLFDNLTYNLSQKYQLPTINKPIKIIGKGSTIHGENYIKYGLFFQSGANGSEVEDLRLTGFTVSPLSVQCNNSIFTSIEIFNNLGVGILLNNASNNIFISSKTTYSGFKIHSNSGDIGYGVQIDEKSNDNTFDGISFGCDLINFNQDLGNSKDGLYIRGEGTVVRNCVFAYNRRNGIELDQPNLNARPTTIINCDFQTSRLMQYAEVGTSDYNDTANQKSGIRIFRGNNITIRNCVFARHRSYGIESGVSGSNIVIDSNVFCLTPANRQMTEFVGNAEMIGESAIKARGNNLKIANNYIGKVKNGVSLFNGDGISIIGNTIGVVDSNVVFSPTNDGIFIGDNVKNLKIGDAMVPALGNRIIGSGRHCIWAQCYDTSKLFVIANNNLGVDKIIKPALPCGESGILLEGNISFVSIELNNISSLQYGIRIRSLPSTINSTIVYTPASLTITKNTLGFVLLDSTQKNNSEAALALEGVKNIDVSRNVLSYSNKGIVCSSDINQNISIFLNQIGALSTTDLVKVNASHGILLKNGCTGVSVGLLLDSTSGNLIYNNGGAAVKVEDSSINNLIVYNIMIGNKQGSISLGDGKLYYDEKRDRDSSDLDSGPNSLQNAPVVTNIDIRNLDAVYLAMLTGKSGRKYSINEYLTLKLPTSSQYLMPAIKPIRQYQVAIPESGVVEISKDIIDIESVELMKKGTHTITLTATNEDLETSQLGSVFSPSGTDLSISYDTTKSVVIGRVIKTYLTTKNISEIKALNVQIVDSMPAMFVIDSVMSTIGVPVIEGSLVKLTLSELNAQDSVEILVIGRHTTQEIHKRYAFVYSDSKEITLANNEDSLFIIIDPTQVHHSTSEFPPTYFSSGQTLRITLNSNYKVVQLIDILGNRVYHKDVNKNHRIFIENIPFGLYMVILTDEANKLNVYNILHF
ncbi:MAG: right-handed parallel beta-helix repeat-containing protein [Ignavibacteria bacterium]|nr:right-handed parallel beta-helix repeat-containing protein [Ignavibacteria bacterium]